MTSIQAPSWAFNAEAIDGIGDTHLPLGVHVRALPSPKLGVPATPLVLYRSVLTPDHVKRMALSDGLIWVDSNGTHLTLPFQVTPENPVYGYFPLPDVIWAELSALPANKAPLVFEAITPSAQGPAAFQTRHQSPYTLAAWTIPLVRVRGQGTVNGIRWLPAERLQELAKFSLWEVWSLPLDRPTPRYTPTPNAPDEAKERVHRAGVLRQPLYVAYSSASPSTAPAATGDDAFDRVSQVASDLHRWVDRLVNDMSLPTWALLDEHPVQGQADSNISVPIEPFLLAGAVDPDVGHYLGFGDVDRNADMSNGSLVIYRVRALWRWDPDRWHKLQLPVFSPAVREKLEEAVRSFPELRKFGIVPKDEGPFLDLHTQAVALIGSPPDVPDTVQFTAAEDRGWLATPPPPNVRRALRLLARGFAPHALAALAATDMNGLRTLHPFVHAGRLKIGKPLPAGTPLPLVVSRPVEAIASGEGRFEDRDAPDSTVDYQLAQGDWFGRWSGWVHKVAPKKERTAPMKPTLELYPHTSPLLNPVTPQHPDGAGMPNPVPNGNISGIIDVRIPIPRTPDLPAGGAELKRLELVQTFEGSAPVTTSYTLGSLSGATIELHTAPAHDLLIINRKGPALSRGGKKKVTYTACWVDMLNLVSINADPAVRTITDPRPPVAPPVITELRYTARPDVQGNARVDLDFGSTVGRRYRVFASNETILLKALDNDAIAGSAAASAAAVDIRAAESGAPRAMKFKLYKNLFGWDHFENLTQQPIVATSSTTHFVHRVSGSLDVLVIYRVLGEGATGVLSELTEADLVPFAVPNLGGPAQPQISVLNAGLEPTSEGVKLRVKVPRAKAVPVAWRLRRASVPVSSALRMDIVAQGAVSGAVIERDGTSFDITHNEPLQPWRQYQFAVEVQAAPPPGAPTVGVILPGEWSMASANAKLSVVPPTAPADPSSVTIANVAGKLKITVHHPAAASLISTALGDHRFEVWRCKAGTKPELNDLLFIRGTGDTWIATDSGPVALAGTYVTVRIIDPLGRRSEARPSNLI